ncbi:MAG TPA: hypothetical protein VK508_01700 [Cyclobacteriaceae bacterium]|nr:hypothetical protein [Cyclobacteriaceae bacterium]
MRTIYILLPITLAIIALLTSCSSVRHLDKSKTDTSEKTEIDVTEKTKDVSKTDTQIKRTTTIEGDTIVVIDGEAHMGTAQDSELDMGGIIIREGDGGEIAIRRDKGVITWESKKPEKRIPVKIKKTIVEEVDKKELTIHKSDSSGKFKEEKKAETKIVEKDVKRNSYGWVIALVILLVVAVVIYRNRKVVRKVLRV